MGPAPAPLSLLRGTHRWHVLLTARDRGPLHASLERLERMDLPGGVRMKIDVDPYSMM
jgi:primosomal protein N' (replication factor Y)